ncbi:MAG: hypothetical protein WA393_11790 [Nitrososphaeraceae archaeon]
MYSRRCIATTLTTVLVIGLLVLLIANSVNLLVFDIIAAQGNSTDTIIENKTGTRSVLRSTLSQGYALANQITVTTDKQTYDPGETVNITIKNVGTQPIHFSGVDSDIKITNQESGKSFIPSPLLLTALIPSGSSKIVVWNQQDYVGQQVGSGNYTALVSIGQLTANTTFAISP